MAVAAARRLTPEQQRLVAEHIEVADRAAFAVMRGWPKMNQHWANINTDEVQAVAYEILCQAVFTWKPEKGSDFGGYAYKRIKYGIIDWLRQVGPYTRSRRERVDVTAVSWVDEGDTELDDGRVPTEHQMSHEQDTTDGDIVADDFVFYCLDQLDPRERYVAHQMYVEGRTLAAIGEDLGVTESRVSQILSKALNRLRRDQGVIEALDQR